MLLLIVFALLALLEMEVAVMIEELAHARPSWGFTNAGHVMALLLSRSRASRLCKFVVRVTGERERSVHPIQSFLSLFYLDDHEKGNGDDVDKSLPSFHSPRWKEARGKGFSCAKTCAKTR